MNPNKSSIETLLGAGKKQAALEQIELMKPGPWRDTNKLKILRALNHHKELLDFAERLHASIEQNELPYEIDETESNHLRRYLAITFSEHGKSNLACQIMAELIEAKPDLAALRREYAFALSGNLDHTEAEVHLRTALELEPGYARSYAQLARLCLRNGRTDEGIRYYMRAAALDPENLNYLQRMLYWSAYSSHYGAEHSFQLARLWAVRNAANRSAEALTTSTSPQIERIKIGFVSSDFYAHPISFHLLPLLQNLDRSDFHISMYSDCRKPDKVTTEMQSLCDNWHNCTALSDRKLAEQIERDQINVLVDLNGHGPDNRIDVFAMQSSAATLSWLGYPASTGLDRNSYRITDRSADPVGLHDSVYSEKIIRLRSGYSSFQPHPDSPDVQLNPVGEVLRLGSFCSLSKLSTLTLDAWCAVLRRVPNSTIYLKRKELQDVSSQEHLLQRFNNRGIVKERIIFASSKPTIAEHLSEYSKIDIALDTFPCNSPTTALEALWMGVPVLTLVDESRASRRTSSILARLELNDFAAESLDGFAEQASSLFADVPALNTLKSGLRERMRNSALLDHEEFAYEFGFEVKKIWREQSTAIQSQQ